MQAVNVVCSCHIRCRSATASALGEAGETRTLSGFAPAV